MGEAGFLGKVYLEVLIIRGIHHPVSELGQVGIALDHLLGILQNLEGLHQRLAL